jgi:hypothetical protein
MLALSVGCRSPSLVVAIVVVSFLRDDGNRLPPPHVPSTTAFPAEAWLMIGGTLKLDIGSGPARAWKCA